MFRSCIASLYRNIPQHIITVIIIVNIIIIKARICKSVFFYILIFVNNLHKSYKFQTNKNMFFYIFFNILLSIETKISYTFKI